jgi:hypothetical protein
MLNISKFSTAFMIIFFYALLICIFGIIGDNIKIIGFNNGLIIGLILSIILWFTIGKKMSKV